MADDDGGDDVAVVGAYVVVVYPGVVAEAAAEVRRRRLTTNWTSWSKLLCTDRPRTRWNRTRRCSTPGCYSPVGRTSPSASTMMRTNSPKWDFRPRRPPSRLSPWSTSWTDC